MMRHSSCFVGAAVLLLTPPTPLHGQQGLEASVAVDAGYVRALGGDGVGGQLNLQWSLPAMFLSATPDVGLHAWIATVGMRTGDAANLAAIGVRSGLRWSLGGGRLQPHLSVTPQLLHAARTESLLCIRLLTGGDCLPTSATGLAVHFAAGSDLRITQALNWTVSVGTVRTGLYWTNRGPLWMIRAGVAYRWSLNGDRS